MAIEKEIIKARKIIRKAAKDAEPLIKKTRKEILNVSTKAEAKVKEFYSKKLKKK